MNTTLISKLEGMFRVSFSIIGDRAKHANKKKYLNSCTAIVISESFDVAKKHFRDTFGHDVIYRVLSVEKMTLGEWVPSAKEKKV